MTPTTIIHAGGGLVKNSFNQFLLIYRNNRWDLPKGKQEANETIADCALREVCEECGLLFNLLCINKFIVETTHCYTLDGQEIRKQTSWFSMTYSGPHDLTPQTEEGITEVGWFAATEASALLSESYASIREVFSYAE